ncbi:MAG: hypothetical protein H6742_05440 [Alphaproteobacteria bacterium]|nr:hypothetical protein [Alphaproteobacteria bacterium]
MRRLALATLAGLTLPGTALAGGIGVLTNAGFHSARAYYYDAEGNQGIDGQHRFNYGVGGVALLGDKDDRVQGVMRLWLIQDQPLAEPDTGETTDAVYPAEYEQGWKSFGAMTAGIQWGLFGDPSKTQLTLETHAGSGFASSQGLEFLLVEAGPGVSVAMGDHMQFYSTLTASMRYRKRAYISENAYVGVRWMFD